MKGSLLMYNLKLNCLIFFYQSKQLADYIHTDIYCNYRNALDRLRVRMNIILYLFIFKLKAHTGTDRQTD